MTDQEFDRLNNEAVAGMLPAEVHIAEQRGLCPAEWEAHRRVQDIRGNIAMADSIGAPSLLGASDALRQARERLEEVQDAASARRSQGVF